MDTLWHHQNTNSINADAETMHNDASGFDDNNFTTVVVEVDDTCVNMNRLLWLLHAEPTARPAVAAMFSLLYAITIALGVGGNSCVLLAVVRTRSLQTVSNVFICALSCSDIIVCCVSATFTPFTALHKEWLFGPTLCSLVPFTAGTSLCFSTFTLAAISLDRFLLVRFPLNNQLRHQHAYCIILLIVMASMALSLPMLFAQNLHKLNGFCGEFCFEDWGRNELYREVYGTLLLIIQFFVPLSIITLCYTGISVRLNKNQILRREKMGNSWQIHHQRIANRRRYRTNRMFLLMVFAFILSWISSVLYNILRDFRLLPKFIAEQEFLYGVITHAIAMTSTVWNPLLYALLNLQFRDAFVRLLPLRRNQQIGQQQLQQQMATIIRNPRRLRFLSTPQRMEYPPMIRSSILVVQIARHRETF